MAVTMNVDTSQFDALKAQLQPNQVGYLFRDSANRAASAAKKVLGSEIAGTYNITSAQVKKNARVQIRKGGANFGAAIEIKGPRLPIAMFVTGARFKGLGGINVSIKGGFGDVLPHAFRIAKYSGEPTGGIRSRRDHKKRYPLRALMTVSVPQMAQDEGVSEGVVQYAGEKFLQRFEQELMYFVGRAGGAR